MVLPGAMPDENDLDVGQTTLRVVCGFAFRYSQPPQTCHKTSLTYKVLFSEESCRSAAPRLMKIFPLNKGGGAKRQRSRSARGFSGRPSQTRHDNPVKAAPSFPLC